MNREQLISKMTDIALETIKHYFTDFTAYDIPRITKVEQPVTYTWSVRDSGTWMFEYENGKQSRYVELIRSQYEGDPSYKEYTIKYDGTEWKIEEGE